MEIIIPREDGALPAIQFQKAAVNADFEFRHHLHDTIILLGGKIEIASLLTKSEDFAVTGADVEELRRYNIGLIERAKEALKCINKSRIKRT